MGLFSDRRFENRYLLSLTRLGQNLRQSIVGQLENVARMQSVGRQEKLTKVLKGKMDRYESKAR